MDNIKGLSRIVQANIGLSKQAAPPGSLYPGSLYLRDVEVPPNKAELLGEVSGDFV
jgi:hypothetical protein